MEIQAHGNSARAEQGDPMTVTAVAPTPGHACPQTSPRPPRASILGDSGSPVSLSPEAAFARYEREQQQRAEEQRQAAQFRVRDRD